MAHRPDCPTCQQLWEDLAKKWLHHYVKTRTDLRPAAENAAKQKAIGNFRQFYKELESMETAIEDARKEIEKHEKSQN